MMRFQTRHIRGLRSMSLKQPPVVFIENTTELSVTGDPTALSGKYWTPTRPIKVDGDPGWSLTRGEPRVRVPMYRYTTPNNPSILAAAMLEMGILARQQLLNFVDSDPEPQFCHLFTSDVFVVDQKGGPFGIFFGLSFQFE